MTDPTEFLDRLSGKGEAMDALHAAALEHLAAWSAADAAFAAYTAWSRTRWKPDPSTVNTDPSQFRGRWSGDDGALLGDNLADAEIAADAALDVAEAAADRLNELCGGRVTSFIHVPARHDARVTQPPFIFEVDELLDHILDEDPAAITADYVLTAMNRVGRLDAPRIPDAIEKAGLLTASAAAAAVSFAWSLPDYPDTALPRDRWRVLFALAGYTADGKPTSRPTGPIVLYRGSVPERRDWWSWSASLEVAREFATHGYQGRPPGQVWTAEVEPWRLFSYNNDRSEQEFVIDTDGLQIEAASATPAP